MALSKNSQWEVTEWGLEAIPAKDRTTPVYPIPAGRLGELREPGFYEWPLQVAKKSWVNVPLFMAAFEAALLHHSGKYEWTFDPDTLKNSATEAAKIHRRDFK